MPLKILLNGARGRMGQAIEARAGYYDATVIGKLHRGDDAEGVMEAVDVVIDFSHHDGSLPIAKVAARHKKPILIGTTGHTEEELKAIKELSEETAVMVAYNCSVGVNLLYQLTRLASEKLPGSFKAEVFDKHHKMKKDAPSGTAKVLVEHVKSGRELSAPVHSVREGEVIGEHTVLFSGPDERLELTHKAEDRHIFANGALQAAQWLVKQGPGYYCMADFLNLNHL